MEADSLVSLQHQLNIEELSQDTITLVKSFLIEYSWLLSMYYHTITVQFTFNKTQECFVQINEKWYKEQSMNPVYQYGLTLIPAKKSKNMSSKLWNEIIALPNFQQCSHWSLGIFK